MNRRLPARRRKPARTEPGRPPHPSRARSPPGSRGSPSCARVATASRPRPARRTARGGTPRRGGPEPRRPSASPSAGSPRPTLSSRRSPVGSGRRATSGPRWRRRSPRPPPTRREPGRPSTRCSPTTARSARGWPRRSGRRPRPASSCATPTTGRARRTSRRWRRASTSSRCASRCWSSSRRSGRSGFATWPRPPATRPTTIGTARRRTCPSAAWRTTRGEGAALESLLEALAPGWAAEPPAAEPPTPGRLAVLRRRYHELGAANPFAVDEYRTLRDRLETLEAQHKDLREAILRTRSLIADLDVLIATQFRTTFAALEVAFDARFQQLFGGGFARLSLTDPNDLSTTGIEITARPPGKKPQALAMLSGGERALTAVALLFAMLEIRPAPFCVLDEVDAALDEANVGRFTDALRDLAERDAVHRDHPQPWHHRGRGRALRRDRRRRLREPRDQPPARRGAGDRRRSTHRCARGPRRRARLNGSPGCVSSAAVHRSPNQTNSRPKRPRTIRRLSPPRMRPPTP